MARPLNFRQIEAFRAVMQTGTTTAAAAMLHTTQPSISRLLAQAQAATQLKLFDVQKGRLRPTHEARQLFETVQRHFLGLEHIEHNIAVLRKSGTGRLRIGCTPALGLAVMPKVAAAFSREHPEIHINLQTVGAVALREGLMHGLYDLVLTTTPIPHPQFESQIVHRSSMVCVMDGAHRLAKRSHVDVGELSGEVLITLNADDPIAVELRRVLAECGVEPGATMETTYSATICMMALEGIGVGIVNPHVASVFAERLTVLPLRPACPVDVFLAFAPQSAPSTIAERFAGLLRDHFRALPARPGTRRTAAGPARRR